MKNFFNIIYTFLPLMILFVFIPVEAQETGYQFLAPLPIEGNPSNLSDYIPGIIKLAIGIAAVMAFVMITFGGIKYATTDAISGKDEGRKHIWDAVIGLVLVLGAYAILYTINPKILEFNFALGTPNISSGTPTVTPGTPMTQEQINQDTAVRNSLPPNVTAYAGPCLQGQTNLCVNLNGLPNSAISGLGNLQQACGCDISITGGTEGGHQTHGVGQPIVDIRKNSVNSYINNHITNTRQTDYGPLHTVNVNGADIKVLDEGDHWHIVF